MDCADPEAQVMMFKGNVVCDLSVGEIASSPVARLGKTATAALGIHCHADTTQPVIALALSAPLWKRRPFRRCHAAVHYLLELTGIEKELVADVYGIADGGTKLVRRCIGAHAEPQVPRHRRGVRADMRPRAAQRRDRRR